MKKLLFNSLFIFVLGIAITIHSEYQNGNEIISKKSTETLHTKQNEEERTSKIGKADFVKRQQQQSFRPDEGLQFIAGLCIGVIVGILAIAAIAKNKANEIITLEKKQTEKPAQLVISEKILCKKKFSL